MQVREAYNLWADQYDSNENKTRDLEAISLRSTLGNMNVETCLEIGCGTGKNTEWLITKSKRVTAVDMSEKMLAKARSKVPSGQVEFIQADINDAWTFAGDKKFDLVTFSLVLEHIEDLDRVFEKLGSVVAENGFVYIGELHPFKQYQGTKARFETENGIQIVNCFVHHISDFSNAATKYDFQIVGLNEFFDENNRNNIPRIVTFLMKKR